tara:strand:+ start:425 stop:1411 length:987 start_codon:yes stop_codon:yes gene_type:complete
MITSKVKWPFAKFSSDFSLDGYKRYYYVVKSAGILVIILTAIAYFVNAKPIPHFSKQHIARIDVGYITSFNAEWMSDLSIALKNKLAKGVVLVIDQAGTGSDLYEIETAINQIKSVQGKKPIISFVYGHALGGNYVLASQTDYIVAQRTATLGGLSIAVSSFDPKPLLNRLGIEVVTKGYGDLKVMPDKKDKNYDAFMQHRNKIYENLYEWMVRTVKANRGLNKQEFDAIARGQWYLGDRALGYRLCDATGDLITAADHIRTLIGEKDLELIDYSHNQVGLANIDQLSGTLSQLAKEYFHFGMRKLISGISRIVSDEISRSVRHAIYM